MNNFIKSPVVFCVTRMTLDEPFTYTIWEGPSDYRRKVTITLPRGYLLHSISGSQFFAPWRQSIRSKAVRTKIVWYREIVTLDKRTGVATNKKIVRVKAPEKLERYTWSKNLKG